jgi:predicted deacetylase
MENLSEISGKDKKINIFNLCVLLILILIFASVYKYFPYKLDYNNQAYIIFRYDDPSSVTSSDFERKIIELINHYGFSIVFGVVPFVSERNYLDPTPQRLLPLSLQRINDLKPFVDSGVVEIALHGYSHQHNNNSQQYSEFKGDNYSYQNRRIIDAKKFIEQSFNNRIFTFIPPFNSYDIKTLYALVNNQFSILSANRWGDYKNEISIKYLPMTTGIIELKRLIEKPVVKILNNSIIVAMLHEYDFVEIDADKGVVSISEFEKILNRISITQYIKNVNFDYFMKNDSEITSGRYEQNKLYVRSFQYFPSFLFKPLNQYLTEEYARRLYHRNCTLVILYYLIIFLLFQYFGYNFGFFFKLKRIRKFRLILHLNFYIIIMAIIISSYNREFGGTELSFITISTGFFVGQFLIYKFSKIKSKNFINPSAG